MSTGSPERWRELQALLDDALDLPEPARESHVDALTNVDDAMRAELLRLVRAAAQSGDFLSRPVVEMAAPIVAPLTEPQLALTAGEIVGHYRIVREIGRGGMGAVYLAVRIDEPIGEQVAIKVLPLEAQTDKSVRRFLEEQHILAWMDHPTIAKLLDGGVTDRRLPYFVMEYVDGQKIDVYCDEHRLTIGDRLRIFCEVCDAVQHAHGKQVVHRDIKPSNILVTTDGKVRLLDFGIAKLLSDDSLHLTSTSTRMMTPEYASPEQVRGLTLTTSSDVYSLGVLLYYLLAGRRPYHVHTPRMSQIVRAILNEDPSPPSIASLRESGSSPSDVAARRGTTPEALRGALEGNLDAICLRALHKKPEDRYASVEEMAADVRRHLEGARITSSRSRVGALARWRRRL